MALGSYLKPHPIGEVFVAPFDVVFSDLHVVEPDLLYISRERWQILTEQLVRGAPDLAVEILSPGTRKTDEAVHVTELRTALQQGLHCGRPVGADLHGFDNRPAERAYQSSAHQRVA